ncbi:MAG: hypothetical protein INR71_06790 [Terriglobus roseus]|nr:hypothetical protein [Terriglobus roseus]
MRRQVWFAAHVRADVGVPVRQPGRFLEPSLASYASAAHMRVAIGSTVGEDTTIEIAQPEIEVDGVG